MKPIWESTDGSVKLWRGDCLTVLPILPESSVSLIATDPPYYKVKGESWDQQWDKPEAFLSWLGGALDEFQRVLAPNGSLYLFASPQMAWSVEGEVRKRFAILNRITWAKHDGTHNKGGLWSRACKEEMRAYFPRTEVVFFAEHFNADNAAKGEAGYIGKCDELRGFVFEPLRLYLKEEFAALGWNADKLNEICGTASMAGRHYTARSQWCLPTAEHYAKLQAAANGDAHLRREYEDLRRPFNARADAPYTDVWDFPTVAKYPGKHPCEKPLAMMEHIVELSSRPGDVVLDAFLGSAVTGQAAKKHGRQFIGIEQNADYFASAIRRIQRQEQDERQPTLFPMKPTPPTQQTLWRDR